MGKQYFSRSVLVGVLGLVLVCLLFIAVTLIANYYQEPIATAVAKSGYGGPVIYVLFTIIATVVAPVSTLPLLPLATASWGWWMTGLLSSLGWVLGAQSAFYIARKYGKKVVGKIISLEKLMEMENKLSTKHIFWTIVFLRMVVPVDILSYALGIFSNVPARTFFFATVLGVLPFAFIFSYAGSLPLGAQVVTMIEIAIFLSLIYLLQKAFFPSDAIKK